MLDFISFLFLFFVDEVYLREEEGGRLSFTFFIIVFPKVNRIEKFFLFVLIFNSGPRDFQ